MSLRSASSPTCASAASVDSRLRCSRSKKNVIEPEHAIHARDVPRSLWILCSSARFHWPRAAAVRAVSRDSDSRRWAGNVR
eukprot:scaffold20771_cov51-Isochrysis_galbana.AAC.1